MKGKKHSAEQIIKKLREADAMLATGKTIGQVVQTLEISEQTLTRWRNQYGGMKSEEAKRLKTLAEETGVQARTLAALARERPGSDETVGPQLWLVDEAGKLSSRQAANLFEKAQATGAKVVLVGDRLQHAAVEAGMPFA